VINSIDRLEEFAQNLAAGQDGTVSIACYPVHIERFLGRVIGSFRLDHPRVRFDLTRLRDDRRRGLGRSLLRAAAAAGSAAPGASVGGRG
jgi:DNA-binding transcriptional LysR family regulator